MAKDDGGCFDSVVKVVTALGALATVGALFVFSCQTEVFRDQLRVQEEASSRSAVANALSAIYDPHLRVEVREEAVRTYIVGQRSLGRPLRLREADFSKMHLERESFWNEELDETKKADLFGAKFSDSFLEGTILTGADLRQADFGGATLIGANLKRADLSLAQFYGANLAGADLTEATLAGTLFSQRSFQSLRSLYPAIVNGVEFRASVFDDHTWFCGVDANRARLAQARGFTKQHLKRCRETPVKVDGETTLPFDWP